MAGELTITNPNLEPFFPTISVQNPFPGLKVRIADLLEQSLQLGQTRTRAAATNPGSGEEAAWTA